MKFSDQLSRTIDLKSFPLKKSSPLFLLKLNCYLILGLDEEVIGITKFCVHPDHWFRAKKRVGGTKKLNLPLIRELQPDLIIANKEENKREEVEELMKEFPVWISDVGNLEDAYDMIGRVGQLVGRPKNSNELVDRIKEHFVSHLSMDSRSNLKSKISNPRTVYLIWKEPYMTVGGDTFINDMMNRCGFENIFEKETRYPELSLSQLSSALAEASAYKSATCLTARQAVNSCFFLQNLFLSGRNILMNCRGNSLKQRFYL